MIPTLPTKTIFVRNKQNDSVPANLEIQSLHDYYDDSTYIRLSLKINDRIIGEADFKFKTESRTIFVTDLKNHTIHYGEREFSRVGTGLLDIIKQIGVTLNYNSIHLQAQTPFCTPLPKNNNLVEFFNKMGFRYNGYGSSFVGYPLQYQFPSS